jgi:hypothetical protein
MRLKIFMAAALAVSTLAGTASAHGSWGGSKHKVSNKVLVCYQISPRTLKIKGKAYYPGLLVRLAKAEADKLVKAKKAVMLNETAWHGRLGCLIGTDGKPVDENGNPPPPVVTPPPPPPANNGGGNGNGGDHDDDHDDDDDDDDHDDDDDGDDDDDDDDEAPPPPPPPPAG